MAEAVQLWSVEYQGKIIGVNQWTETRAIYSPAKRKYVGTTYKSTKYDNFCNEFILQCRRTQQCMVAGYVDMYLGLCLWAYADTPNFDKAICDALEPAGVIENDRFIRHEFVVRTYHKKSAPDRMKLVLQWVGPHDAPIDLLPLENVKV